ncbi:MAG: hypothetical protein IJY11_02770 [Clostridia bacterium]|nr:hypothetical protein [Clostridia bacterium]
MKYLQITCTIISALFVAALFPCGMIFGWTIASFLLIGAFLFFGLMLLCKQNTKSTTNDEPMQPTEQNVPSEETNDDTK